MSHLAQWDNDPVSVSVKGFLVDVDAVAFSNGQIALKLDSEEMRAVLEQLADGDPGPGEDF
jgi:hypothetical protein